MTKLEGEFEIASPFFLEYMRVLNERLISVEDINKFSFSNHIIIVNPNNPDGRVIKIEVLHAILDKLKKNGKYLIYDESFADFSINNEISLLNNPDLLKKDNLIILKSLGKTYGIAGIRLGILINTNKKNIHKWRENLPIWNINSLSEVFLDLLPRYKKEYQSSLEKIANNSQNFYQYLLSFKNDLFEVYKPTANFILISFSSLELLKKVEIGLFKNFYLTKSLKEREGLPKYCMRIAVLDDQTNKNISRLIKELIS